MSKHKHVQGVQKKMNKWERTCSNVIDMAVQVLKLCPLPFFLHFFGTPCTKAILSQMRKNYNNSW